MKIVLVRNINYSFDSVCITGFDGWTVEEFLGEEYVQLSDIIDVDFPMLDVDINEAKIKAIDEDIKKAKAGIEKLEQEKAELLAIPDMSAENEQ